MSMLISGEGKGIVKINSIKFKEGSSYRSTGFAL
jgi:hypothetical protein